jgi:hypothetical protein
VSGRGSGPSGRSGDVYVDDRKWRELLKTIDDLAGANLKIGVLASKGGEAQHPKAKISIIELAAIHEFGSPAANIPERSFLRAPMRNAKWLPELCAKLTKGVMIGRFTPERALAILGETSVAAIKKYITTGDGVPPPLQPETIARKGSSRPLVDTSRLLNSITYAVEVKK